MTAHQTTAGVIGVDGGTAPFAGLSRPAWSLDLGGEITEFLHDVLGWERSAYPIFGCIGGGRKHQRCGDQTSPWLFSYAYRYPLSVLARGITLSDRPACPPEVAFRRCAYVQTTWPGFNSRPPSAARIRRGESASIPPAAAFLALSVGHAILLLRWARESMTCAADPRTLIHWSTLNGPASYLAGAAMGPTSTAAFVVGDGCLGRICGCTRGVVSASTSHYGSLVLGAPQRSGLYL